MAYFREFVIVWNDGFQDIKIKVLYVPLKFGIISHLEFRSIAPERAPLPITQTGYLSHHFHPDSIDFADYGGVEAFTLNWLNKEAEKLEWKSRLEAVRQYSLF